MPPFTKEIEATAYCRCGYCCNWEWGLILPGPFYLGFSPTWKPLRLRRRRKGNFHKSPLSLIAKYWSATNLIGSPYYGFTSNGNFPAQARPPLLSALGLMQYKSIPGRLLLPWKLLPRHGTIAADTNYYPFQTQMFVPGYGRGKVEDRGGDIKGPTRIDLYFESHNDALKWGRQKVQVVITLPGQGRIDSLRIPGPIKATLKALDHIRHFLF